MIDALFCQPSYLATKKLLDATALRQAALASNLANLETPQYKRIDLAPSFREEFERAVHAGNGKAINQIAPALAVDNKTRSANRDGNTVELENELLQMSQNTLEHSFGTQLITRSLQKMRTAITGRSS